MVKIVDGYKKREEALNQHRTLLDLAIKYFKGNIDAVISNECAPITVREGFTGCDVEIYPRGIIDVHKKSYFESAMKFAEDAEKVMGREFTLNTTYKL